MVKNRPRQRNNRRRTTKRSVNRQLHHLMVRCPVRCRVPRDPPQLPRTVDCTQRIQINFVLQPSSFGKTKGEFITPGNFEYPAVYKLAASKSGVILATSLSVKELSHCLASLVGNFTACYLELSFLKILAWGPITSKTVTSSLIVDVGLDSGVTTVLDTNSTTTRPRCGISIPHRVWYCGTSEQEVIRYHPDQSYAAAFSEKDPRWPLTETTDMGCLHITMHYRRGALA